MVFKEVFYAIEWFFLEDETKDHLTFNYRIYLLLTTIPSFFYCVLYWVYYRLRYRKKSQYVERGGL
jgi:hypothetical protein